MNWFSLFAKNENISPDEALLGTTVEQVVLRSACPVASVNHPDKVADL